MNLPSVRPPDHEQDYFSTLPYAVKWELGVWDEIVKFVGAARTQVEGIKGAAMKWKHLGNFSEPTIKRKIGMYRKSGDWKVFIDKRKLKKQTLANNILPIYRDYALANQRSNREGWQRMMIDFRAGKYFPDIGDWRNVWAEQHPGLQIPRNYPANWIPEGWHYSNLQKIAGITPYEVTAMRKGRAAARDFLPPVLTTRIGLPVGGCYQMDDVWHDCVFNAVDSNRRAQRGIEMCIMDVASGYKAAWGMQPRYETAAGKMQNIPETRALELTAFTLCNIGYHPDRCLIVGEHGTAKLDSEVQKVLKRLSGNAIEITAGGILDKALHAGLFPGAKRGNFKLKASLESSHGLYHSVAAHLPGQMGMSPERAPEELGEMDKHNAHLLTCYRELMKRDPARAAKLRFDVLTFQEYLQAIRALYDIVSERTDHDLEGWESCGYVTTEFRVSRHSPDYEPLELLDTFPLEEQQAIRALIRSNPAEYTQSRRLSRREVFEAGKPALKTFSKFTMPHLLGEKLGFMKKVKDNGMISFHNQDFGPDEYFYNARQMKAPDGFVVSLHERREYVIHANPFNLDEIYVSDPSSGAVLGILPRYGMAMKTDTEAIRRKIGKQAKEEARLMQPIINLDTQRRRQETRLNNLNNNIKVLNGSPVTDDEIEADALVRSTRGDASAIFESEDEQINTGEEVTTGEDLYDLLGGIDE